MKKFLRNFFLPHPDNNHKAHALHHFSLAAYVAVFLLVQFTTSALANHYPRVLGFATNITVNDVFRYTNEEREKNQISDLTLNDKLNLAAQRKAEDMFSRGYWSHNSPQGTTPWSFITQANYYYLLAGENLARDFNDSQAVVNAWMKSSTHKENIVNSKYKDIGIAVVNGRLNGIETTLVVQMFGTQLNDKEVLSSSAASTLTQSPLPPAPPAINLFSLTKRFSLVLTIGLLILLLLDVLLIYRRKIFRLAGNSLAHMVFLIMLSFAVALISRGSIL